MTFRPVQGFKRSSFFLFLRIKSVQYYSQLNVCYLLSQREESGSEHELSSVYGLKCILFLTETEYSKRKQKDICPLGTEYVVKSRVKPASM